MGYKTLEVTLISAKDLKNVNLIGKMDVYVVAYLSNNPNNNKQKTPVHQDGGTAPRWNHTLRFTLDDSPSTAAAMLVLQLKHEHTFGSDKDLGQVQVPLRDLLSANKDAPLVYQVRRPSGRPKGELKFSCRVTDAVYAQPQQQKASPFTAYPPPVTAYPPTAAAYPPPPVTAYPPQMATAYPPPPPYGGYMPQQQPPYGGYGYGYPVQVQLPRQQKVRRNGGLGMGAGLLGGALGGLLIGDMISDSHGYGGGYDDGGYDGGFDGGYDGGGGDFDMDF